MERAIADILNWHETPRVSSIIITPYVGDNATILDEFTRADSTDLGANWDGNYSGFTNAQIVGNCLRVVATGDPETAESWNALTPTANQWAQVRLKTFNTGTGGEIFGGVVLRAATPTTRTMYWIAAYTNNIEQFTVIRKRVAGVEDEITFTPQVWAQGDIFRAEMSGTGFVVKRNGLVTQTGLSDASIASGRVGIYMYVSSGAAATDLELDDFRAGNL